MAFWLACSIAQFTRLLYYIRYVLLPGFQLAANIVLSNWSTDAAASTDTGVRNKYLGIYGILGMLQSLFILLASAYVMVGTLNAATKMHGTMLARIMRYQEDPSLLF